MWNPNRDRAVFMKSSMLATLVIWAAACWLFRFPTWSLAVGAAFVIAACVTFLNSSIFAVLLSAIELISGRRNEPEGRWVFGWWLLALVSLLIGTIIVPGFIGNYRKATSKVLTQLPDGRSP